MQSSSFENRSGTLLDFPMAPSKRVGIKDYPVETALRMGVPISTTALLMGSQQYTLPAQSALLNPDAVTPTGMYTVRSSSLPVGNKVATSTQVGGVLPQMARMWGAPATTGPVLLEPRAYVANGDKVFRKPYMTPGEAKRDSTSGRVQESVEKTVRQTRSGLAEMSARYGTQMLPGGHSFGDQGSFLHHQAKAAQAEEKAKAEYLGSFAAQYKGEASKGGRPNFSAEQRMGAEAYGTKARKDYMSTTPYAHDGRGIVMTTGPPVPPTMSSYGVGAPQRNGGEQGTWQKTTTVNPTSAQDPAYAYADRNPYGGYKVQTAPSPGLFHPFDMTSSQPSCAPSNYHAPMTQYHHPSTPTRQTPHLKKNHF